MWTEFFDRIVVINLPKRLDRLLEVTEEMDKYNIPFELVDGMTSELGGAEGLRLTVEKIFKESIEKEHKNILIFEDDVVFVENPNSFMDEVVKQLPENYDIVFLGCQCTKGMNYRYSPNLLQLDGAFATHAAFYSLQGMREIINNGLKAPIDNYYVSDIQTLQRCYVTFPLLATQRAGVSSIGNTYIEWDKFITPRYYQKLGEMPQ
jgi:GR25 family glycosyltransferase involved in LPS biosynthesis